MPSDFRQNFLQTGKVYKISSGKPKTLFGCFQRQPSFWGGFSPLTVREPADN